MPIVADAAVAVRGDMSGFNRDMKGAGTQADTLGAKFKSALTPGNLLAAGGIGFGLAQVTSFIGDATSAAAEFQDSISATGIIFGQEMIAPLEQWAETAHEAFGASKQDALAAANQFAVFGKSAGLMGDELMTFSTSMVQLGGDLASMFGGTTQDAITAVGAALRGESEPIRRYGVLLDDATLRQRAFEMGLISTTQNALTPQQRVLAAQAEILAQTSDAQGDFERTSDGMANTQRALAAELENVNIEIGEKLLPIMLELVNWVKDTGIPVMREFIDLLDFGDVNSAEGIPVLGEIEGFLNDASDAALRFNDTITFHQGDIESAAERMGTTYEETRDRIRDAMHDMGISHEDAVDKVVADWERGIENAKRAATSFGELPSHLSGAMHDTGGFDDAVEELVDGLPEGMQDAQDEAAEVARKTPGALADELRASLDDYDEALQELTDMAANSVSDLAERQKIEGILASEQLTEALTSDSLRTRLNAQELVADLVSDYNLLAPGALGAGQLVNPALKSGMDSNIWIAVQAGEAVRDAAGNPLVDTQWAFDAGYQLPARFAEGMRLGAWLVYREAITMASAARGVLPSSEPKDPQSPLRGLIDAGRSVGERFAMGIRDSIPGIQTAMLAAAGAATLHGALDGVSGLPFGAEADGVRINQYILNVEGRPVVVGTAEDVLDRWAQETSLAKDGVQ
jgi:hypothetical protein